MHTGRGQLASTTTPARRVRGTRKTDRHVPTTRGGTSAWRRRTAFTAGRCVRVATTASCHPGGQGCGEREHGRRECSIARSALADASPMIKSRKVVRKKGNGGSSPLRITRRECNAEQGASSVAETLPALTECQATP